MHYFRHKIGVALASGSFFMDVVCAMPKNQHVIRVNSATFVHLPNCRGRKWLNLRDLAARSSAANFAPNIPIR
jgi:ribosomal protein S27E